MGLRFTQLMYSLWFLFFFSLLDDGGSCCCLFRLVVASVGAELWSDSLMLSLLRLELLRCDFVGRLFLGWKWRKREKNESPREDSRLCLNSGFQSLSQNSVLSTHEFLPTRHEAAADISKLATWGVRQEQSAVPGSQHEIVLGGSRYAKIDYVGNTLQPK